MDALFLEECGHRIAAHDRQVAAKEHAIEAGEDSPDHFGVLADELVHPLISPIHSPASRAGRMSRAKDELDGGSTLEPPWSPESQVQIGGPQCPFSSTRLPFSAEVEIGRAA